MLVGTRTLAAPTSIVISAAPVDGDAHVGRGAPQRAVRRLDDRPDGRRQDRKSTRLNSSHSQISYAVFCLKKKKKRYQQTPSFRDYQTLEPVRQYHTLID